MSRTAIFLGSKPASVAALLLLIRRGWEVLEVVASDESQEWLPKPNLAQVARSLGIRVVSTQSELVSENADLVISYMCRSLVKAPTLRRGIFPINFHAAPLPEYGGWAFYNLAILERAAQYGCTCHIMDESFDTGPIVKVRRFSINERCETAFSLERRAQIEMLLLFEEILSIYECSGHLEAAPQSPERMRYVNESEFKRLKQIPTGASPEEADRIARAFWYPPYDVAYYVLSSGAKIEVVPDIVKLDIARHMHAHDLESSLSISGVYLPS